MIGHKASNVTSELLVWRGVLQDVIRIASILPINVSSRIYIRDTRTCEFAVVNHVLRK